MPPTPSAPSLAPPGTGSAPVPLAQAAARGRWPWHSQRHPWPAKDAEWHRLRRGLGSSISITPPWAGTQEPGAAPARGTAGERDPGQSQTQLLPGWEVSRTSRHWPREVLGGLQDHHQHRQHPWAEHRDWLQPRRTQSLETPLSQDQNLFYPGTKLPPFRDKIPLRPSARHVHSHCPLEHSSAGLHSLFEVRNPVFPHFCT